jgi:hypothetical protein
MPTERELIQEYKTTKAAAQLALNRFLSACFTETLLVRDDVSSSALAAHFAAKLARDDDAVQILSVMALEFLRNWVETEGEKIERARKSRFTEKTGGTEIFDKNRLAFREIEAAETQKKVEAWKLAEHMRHAKSWHRGDEGFHTEAAPLASSVTPS